MSNQPRSWRRPWLRVILLALAVAAAPLPALAGDTPQAPPAGPSLTASAHQAVAAIAARPQQGARFTQSADPPRTDLGSSSFFKTPAGVVTLVVVAVGVGYALYSTSNDRIKSPAR